MNRKEEIIEQTITISKAFKKDRAHTYIVSQILKRAKWLTLIHVRQCNGYTKPGTKGDWDNEAEEKDKVREQRVKEQLQNFFDENLHDNATYEFQEDPRGAPIILHWEDKELGRVWG